MFFVILPLVGALIGWVTNRIAIRLLFRPLRPVKLAFSLISFQGLIPKRRGQIAEKIGQVVSEQLLSMEELSGRLNMPELQKEVEYIAKEVINRWCNDKMSILPVTLRQYCSNYLRDMVAAEMAAEFPVIASRILNKAKGQVDVRQVVSEKINNLSLEDAEKLVIDVAGRELKQIEFLGAVLGLVIGMLQALLLYFLRQA